MPPKKTKRKRFTTNDLDRFCDLREDASQLVALYQQVCHARLCAEESEEAYVQEIEAELLGDYLEKTTELAAELKKIEDRVPRNTLEAFLRKLPKDVLHDLLELQPA